MSSLTHILSLPKTIWCNFRYLPFRQAIRFPIAVHYNTRCKIKRGGVVLNSQALSPMMIRIGFHTVPIIYQEKTVLDIKGKMVFEGTAHIGRGSHIVVQRDAFLELGNNFAISAASNLYCYKHIKLGDNIQLSWGVLIMDSDAHFVLGEDGRVINENKEIIFGNKIWVGCDSKILKGAFIPDNCVVGANTVVTSSPLEPNTLITGCPAKSVKRIIGFRV